MTTVTMTTEKNKFYYCLDSEITRNINLVINFVLDTKEELEYLKDNDKNFHLFLFHSY